VPEDRFSKRLKELHELKMSFHAPPKQKLKLYNAFRKANPEFDKVHREQKALMQARYRSDPERRELSNRMVIVWRIRVKNKLFELLGGKKCYRCGLTDERVLQFDHINGMGRADRRKWMGHSDRLRDYYVKHPELAKKTLQVVCSNCNLIKTWEKNENHRKYLSTTTS